MKENYYKDKLTHYFGVQLVAFGVMSNGALLIFSTLVSQFIRHSSRTGDFSIEAYLLIGLTLIYLGDLLRRRKHTAWLFALLVYAVYLLVSFDRLSFGLTRHYNIFYLFRDFILPIIIVVALALSSSAFTVRSDIRSFGVSLRIIFIVLVVTMCYGVAGFQLMDDSDFHHEIGLSESIHRTIDQFGLTTNSTLVPYTRRARVFLDSLNVISVAAVGYTLLSLFQPLKARFEDQTENRNKAKKLLAAGNNSSEDFFKLWPHDKYYYFNYKNSAGIAFGVHRGIALAVGDPFGSVADFRDLIINFIEFCRINDWQPSFIHTIEHFNPLYKNLDFTCQKIGEEAIVDNTHFLRSVADNKYFRNISNKFAKAGYSTELLKPPHSKEIVNRLGNISREWLKLPGRTERSFLMGYFTEAYMQQCNILVAKDNSGVIQAFINQVPSYDEDEANYDMLRHSASALGNCNDYLLMNFIGYASEQGFKRLNLGLCPLVGLDKNDQQRSLIDSALSFLYSNGDRFYSFSGLHRFKQKYEPKWSNRYIVYKGGIRGLTRTLNALNIAGKPHKFHK